MASARVPLLTPSGGGVVSLRGGLLADAHPIGACLACDGSLRFGPARLESGQVVLRVACTGPCKTAGWVGIDWEA